MTLAERIEKVKQATALIDEVLNDMDQGKEAGEVYYFLIQAKVPLHKAHLRFRRRGEVH